MQKSVLLGMLHEINIQLNNYKNSRTGVGHISNFDQSFLFIMCFVGIGLPFLLMPGMWRNHDLTAAKKGGVLHIQNELNKLSTEIVQCCEEGYGKLSISVGQAKEFTNKIAVLVDLLVNTNKALHLKDIYRKDHRTYKESRDQGYSPFDSWRRKTTFQSLLSKTCEECVTIIERFTARFLSNAVVEPPAAYNPKCQA